MTIIYTVITLGAIGSSAAVILYFVAQKFKVYEDPRIDDVEGVLPAANCGGCGYAGCRAFAEACVKEGNLADLYCPVGGNDCMADVAKILGIDAVKKEPRVAVLRCNGACEHRPSVNRYDGATTCAIIHATYSGETNCRYGCLGCGDCCNVCDFDALHMDAETSLPVVDEDKCTACGACVRECPKDLFELRKKLPKYRKIYVSCRNEDKGPVNKRACAVACIGCSKCFKVCDYDAIVMNNNLAFIDSDKCRFCRKCPPVCPTNAIIETGFPPRKVKPEASEEKPTVNS